MPSHPDFANLVLHDDAALGRLLGAPVAERETIHAWPLSCVQAVRLADGTRHVYKSQLPPTVEAEFYAAAAGAPLLAGHRDLGMLGAARTMTVDWIDAPLLRDVAHGEDELAAHGRRILAALAELPARGLPVHLDLGTPDALRAAAEWAADTAEPLAADGRFPTTGPDLLDAVRAWAGSAPVRAALEADGGTGLLHGDLNARQVFVTADGYRVVDWQRPVLGPPEADLASLLVDAGADPLRHCDPTAVGVFWLVRLHWAVQAQAELFPDLRAPVFDTWAHEAATSIRALHG